MKKSNIAIFLFIILIVFISVILFRSKLGKNNMSLIAIPENAVIYTDDESIAMLKDENLYAMSDLIQQEVYLIDQVLNVDFRFGKKADQSQINNARGFVITRFILRSGEGAFLGSGPHVNIIQNKDIFWNTVDCKIYLGDELVYDEVYNDKGQLIKPQ